MSIPHRVNLRCANRFVCSRPQSGNSRARCVPYSSRWYNNITHPRDQFSNPPHCTTKRASISPNEAFSERCLRRGGSDAERPFRHRKSFCRGLVQLCSPFDPRSSLWYLIATYGMVGMPTTKTSSRVPVLPRKTSHVSTCLVYVRLQQYRTDLRFAHFPASAYDRRV